MALTDNLSLMIGNSSVGSGLLTVIANGAITQNDLITASGAASFTAGSNAITLTNINNAFSGTVSLNNSGNNAVALINSGLLTLSSSSVGSGTLTLTSVGLGQSGPMTQAGAGAVDINAGAGAIALTDTGNLFLGNISLNNSGANNVALVNSATLTLGASSLGSGTLSLTADARLADDGRAAGA